MDGGYTATDYVLRSVLNDNTCKYITVTNADNSYGSEVVQRVLEYSVTLYGKSSTYTSTSRSSSSNNNEGEASSVDEEPSASVNKENTDPTIAVNGATSASSASGDTTAVVKTEKSVSSKAITMTPPMLLAPLDSRNFNIGTYVIISLEISRNHYTRHQSNAFYITYIHTSVYILFLPYFNYFFSEYQHRRFNRASYDEGCRGLNALLEFNMLTYTTQPLPRVGRVDLASLFLNREALRKENVVFGK